MFQWNILLFMKKYVITEKNDEMKNSKGKKKISAKNWCSGEILMNSFIYIKESLPWKKNNIIHMKTIWLNFHTQYFTRNRIFI